MDGIASFQKFFFYVLKLFTCSHFHRIIHTVWTWYLINDNLLDLSSHIWKIFRGDSLSSSHFFTHSLTQSQTILLVNSATYQYVEVSSMSGTCHYNYIRILEPYDLYVSNMSYCHKHVINVSDKSYSHVSPAGILKWVNSFKSIQSIQIYVYVMHSNKPINCSQSDSSFGRLIVWTSKHTITSLNS